MPKSSRNDIYTAVIRRMVEDALHVREEQFALEHGEDTNEQLAQYLRACAQKLRHTPWPREIDGGTVLRARFGSWEQALEMAKLPLPSTPDKISSFARIQEETERQKMIYREKKAEKKARAQRRIKTQKERRGLPD